MATSEDDKVVRDGESIDATQFIGEDFGSVDPIAELERHINQLREQGMSANREKEMLELAKHLRQRLSDQFAEFYWLHNFNMKEMGGPFPTVEAAQADAEGTFKSADVALRDLDGMIVIARTVLTLRADVKIEWSESLPCGLHPIKEGRWGCLECDESWDAKPSGCARFTK